MEYIISSNKNLSDLFKLLAHPARIAILDELRESEACVCHLEALLGLRQSYISQQLSLLRQAGLVVDRRDGWNVYYHVAEPSVLALLDLARQATHTPLQPRPTASACTCPKCSEKQK